MPLSRTKTMLAAFLAIYFVFAIGGERFAAKREWFPVFSWSLFTKVQDRPFLYRLEITSIDDHALDPPQFYRALADRLPQARKAGIRLHKLLQGMTYNTFVRGGVSEAQLNLLRTQYFDGARNVDWRLVRLKVDPIDHYRTGAVISRQLVASGRSEARR